MSALFWPTVLLLVALLVVILEAFVPSGGLLSVLAAVAFASSIATAFMYGGLKAGTAFLATTGITLPLLVWLLVKLWPKTPLGRRILIQPPSEDEVLSPLLTSLRQLVGRRGIALTAMLPSGAIRLDGRTMDAISESLPIEPNTPVEVVAVRGNHLVVRPAVSPDDTLKQPRSSTSADTLIPDPFDDSPR